MSHGEKDYDWPQSFFPGWREEDQNQEKRNNGGPDQNHQLNQHPAFADAAQMAQAAHAAYVPYHHSQSPQARTVQMNQQGQPPGQYPQGMDQTLFRSQLHRQSQYEQSQQQPRPQAPAQQQPQQQSLRLPQPQPYNQAQHRVDHQQSQTYEPYGTQHQAPRQPPQDHRDQLQQYYRETQHQHQTQAQPGFRPQQDPTQHTPQQYQYRDAPHQPQLVRPSAINPSASYYQPNSSRSYASLAPVRSPVQESASGPTLAPSAHTALQSPGETHSGLPTAELLQRTLTSPKSHHSGPQSPSLASPPTQTPVPAPSVQKNSTPMNTQKNVPETRPQTPPSAPGQSQASSKQQAPRRGSFLEDPAIFSTTSPQKDPYTSSSRSTLGPRVTAAKPSTATAAASTPDQPTKRPSVSHSHPSPKSVTSTAGPVSASAHVFTPMSAPAQPRTSGSPPVRNSTPAAVSTDRSSMGASTTSASSRSPPVPSVNYAIPPALRAYATPQMHRAYTPPQPVKDSAPPRPSAQIARSTSAPSVPPAASRPTVPTVPTMPQATLPAQPSTIAAKSTPAGPAAPQHRKTTVPPQQAAQIARSTSATSVSPNPTAPAAPLPPKAAGPPQMTAQMARSTSTTSAPPHNITRFVPTSTPPTTSASSAPVTTRPIAAPPAPGNGRNSPLLPQARPVGAGRKRGRPQIYPDVPLGPVNQAAGVGQLVDGRTMHSHSSPSSNGRPIQYQPVPSGLPTLRNIASTAVTGLAPASPQAWRPPLNPAYPVSASVPRPVIRTNSPLGRFAPGPRAPYSQIRVPTGVSRPGKMNSPPNLARTVARPAGQNAVGSLQARPASTQSPAAKMRKLDDSSRHAVTPPSKTLDLGRYARQSPSRKHITYRSDIVEPVKISDVLVKMAYDPTTIARDILIVADKHPNEKALNHHLHTIRQNFQAVQFSSDLATFRWDLVDPWVQYPPGIEEALARAQQMATASALGPVPTTGPPNLPNSPNLPLNSPGLPHVSTRDVPTAPLPRPGESHFGYSTGTVSPVTVTGTSTNKTTIGLASSDPTGATLINSGSISPGKFVADRTSTGTTNTNVVPNYQAHPSPLTSPASPASTPKSTDKAIPIPPSAVNLNAFGALPFKFPSHYSPLRPTAQSVSCSLPSLPPPSSPQKVQPSVSSPVPTPLPQSTPRKSVESVTVPSSSPKTATPRSETATPRPVPQQRKAPTQSPRDKVPRQSPLPKGLPEPQVVIPISPGVMAPPKKKIGRPAQRDVRVEVAIDNRPTPKYQVFCCKWTGCQAELHNLQSLQAHLVGVHIPHHTQCSWTGCSDMEHRAASKMWKHVQENHIKPLAWQLGDGLSVSANAKDSHKSPEISNQDRNDTMTLPADRDSVKIFSRIHGTQTGKQKAQVMEDGGLQWKEGGGPDADGSDRALSTPLRLLTSSHTETAYTMPDVQVVI